jgi:hypothetical protein
MIEAVSVPRVVNGNNMRPRLPCLLEVGMLAHRLLRASRRDAREHPVQDVRLTRR